MVYSCWSINTCRITSYNFFHAPFCYWCFFAGIVSLITDSQDIQLGTFVVFSIVGVYISVKIFGPRKQKKEESTDFSEGVNKYIGTTFVTTDEIDIYEPTLQHVYGDDWQVVSVDRRIVPGTEVKVVSVNGTKLEVQTSKE